MLCVPQKSAHVSTRSAYLRNCEDVLAQCERLAAVRWSYGQANFRLNTRDIVSADEIYMAYTGSSIESGDEGVVGRGNRVSGLITPLRPMNLEGVSGKNPVYHVGKLYNVAADRLARALHHLTGDYAEVHLVSATGQRLDRPWRILVRLATGAVEKEDLIKIISAQLDAFPELTAEIIGGSVELC